MNANAEESSAASVTDSDYGPPFDDADADVIFRSSDGVRFQAYRVILSKASPFFRDMFSIPQPQGDIPPKDSMHPNPVIPVSEHSRTLASLLRLCYPLSGETTAKADTLQEMVLVLAAARKYDIDCAYRVASISFSQSPLVAMHPAQAFGLACKLHLEDEAREAALIHLRKPMSLVYLGPEMEFMDGREIHCLWQYHRQCADKGSSLARDFSWIERRDEQVWSWANTSTGDCRCKTKVVRVSNGENWQAREWWTSYMERAREGLTKTPASTTVTALRILYPSIEKAGPCSVCCQLAAEAMISFSNHFAKQVDLQIAQVSRFSLHER